MHSYVVFEQVQPFKGFWAQETRVGAVFCVHQQMVLQGRVTHEAFAADVAGEGVRIPAVDPQVLIQLLFVPEGLATVGAFKRTETLPDEKVLQRCVLTWTRGKTEELQRVKTPAVLLRHFKRLVDVMESAGRGISSNVT